MKINDKVKVIANPFGEGDKEGEKYIGDTGAVVDIYEDTFDVKHNLNGRIFIYHEEEIELIKDRLQIKVKKLSSSAVIPQYTTLGDACVDLVADEDIIIQPGETIAVSTGLSFEILEGYKMCVYPRSGISLKTPLRIANSPAQIDSGFRGEVKVIITNIATRKGSQEDGCFQLDNTKTIYDYQSVHPYPTYVVRKGNRIAQAEIVPVLQVEFEESQELSTTERGGGGFGHSGV